MTANARPQKLALPILATLALSAAAGVLVLTATDPMQPDRLFGLWRLRHAGVALVLVLAGLGLVSRSIGRGAFHGFAIAVATATLTLGALELAGRAGLIDWSTALSPAPTEDAAVGWQLQPGIDVTGTTGQDIAARLGMASDPIPFRFQADRYGFRNGDDPEGEIVILGDSIVLGAAIPQELTVAEQVEDRTGREVMQAALLGLAIQQEQDMLLTSGLPLQGKTVVQFLFEGNDLLDSRHFRDRNTATDKPASGFLIRVLWDRLVRATAPAEAFETCRIDGQTYAFLWTARSFRGVEGEFDHIAAAITEFDRRLADLGARYALVLVPTKYRVLHGLCAFPPDSLIADPAANLSDLPDKVGHFAETAGIPYLDLTAALAEAANRGDVPWFWGDTHWNATGHAVAAEAIAGSGAILTGR